jgi:DNA-directed RNA polymerase specialized sigma24 family protein
MKDQAKCFILTPDGYEEITYAELTYRRETDPSYAARRFIPVHGTLLEVREGEYKDFYQKRRRKKYLDEEAARVGEFSYNSLDTDEMNGEDIIADPAPPIDDAVSDKLLIEQMLVCFGQLDEDDRAVLSALYFEGKSERILAGDLGIPRMTLNYRKAKALDRLRRMMKI